MLASLEFPTDFREQTCSTLHARVFTNSMVWIGLFPGGFRMEKSFLQRRKQRDSPRDSVARDFVSSCHARYQSLQPKSIRI